MRAIRFLVILLITFVRTFHSHDKNNNNNKNESVLMATIHQKHNDIPSIQQSENQHLISIEPFLKPFLPESKVSSFLLNPRESDEVSKTTCIDLTLSILFDLLT